MCSLKADARLLLAQCVSCHLTMPSNSGVMLLGPPGVGKTYAVKAVRHICRSWCKVRCSSVLPFCHLKRNALSPGATVGAQHTHAASRQRPPRTARTRAGYRGPVEATAIGYIRGSIAIGQYCAMGPKHSVAQWWQHTYCTVDTRQDSAKILRSVRYAFAHCNSHLIALHSHEDS